jgi:saccharopine dehydrogenase-like NADP-dependent oxidoreductase
MKVVVLGGYGNFGARICRVLALDNGIELIVAARDLPRAQAFAAQLPGNAIAACLDASAADFAAQLAALDAQLLIHTAGPFQGQCYDVAEIAAQVGMHYVDLADGRAFVEEFAPALDAAFKAAGRTAYTGASTLPAVSAAVIDKLKARFSEIETIDICIAPAQRSPRGIATLAAVLSYCGESFKAWNNNEWQTFSGWANPSPVSFAHMPSRLAAVCDVPDLALFPARYPTARSVMFRGALEVPLTQRTLALMAALRQRRLIPRATLFTTVMHHVGSLFDRLGSELGGMFVRVSGVSLEGRPLTLEWHLSVGDSHGPEICCMPAIVLARRFAQGETFEAGAAACVGVLSLDEFQVEFDRWGVRTELIERTA